MVTLTKKQLWKENDEWVVVGVKQNKSMEKGWVLVPDKSKGPPVDEPDRVDKILARYAAGETHVHPSPLLRQYSKTKKLKRALPHPHRHGVCKRSEAKAFLRHGRVTFEGDVVTRPEQRVIVRYVGGPTARPARLPRSSTTRTFFRGERFFRGEANVSARRRRDVASGVAAHAASPRPPPQAVRRRARGRQAHPSRARRRQGERRRGEGGVTSRVARRDARPKRRIRAPRPSAFCIFSFLLS